MKTPRPALVRMLPARPVAAERAIADERAARERLYGRPSVTRRHVDVQSQARRSS